MLNSENINRAGRKKGSKNRISESVRKSFQMLVEDNILQIQIDLDSMSPVDRVNALIKLSAYFLPKLNSIDLTTNIESSFTPVQLTFTTDDTDN